MNYPGGGAITFQNDIGVRPALANPGSFGESKEEKNMGSLGERVNLSLQ